MSRSGARRDEPLLAGQAAEWPTPGATDGGAESTAEKRRRPDSGTGNLKAAAKTWPTPTTAPEAPNTNSNQQTGDPSLGMAAQSWPTPNTADSRHSARHTTDTGVMHPGTTLTDAIREWPTPQAHDAKTGKTPEQVQDQRDKGHGAANLNETVEAWPTPAARDYRTPNSPESEERREVGRETKGKQLPNYVEHDFPSSRQDPPTEPPGSSSSRTTRGSRRPSPMKRRLNPAFVWWLMGLPWWWGYPATISFGRPAMASYRSRLQQRLSYLLADLGSGDKR